MVMFYWFSTFCHKSLNFFTYIQYNYCLSQRKEFSYSQINDYVTTEVRTSTSAEIGWVEQYFHEVFLAKKLYNLVYVMVLSVLQFCSLLARLNLLQYRFGWFLCSVLTATHKSRAKQARDVHTTRLLPTMLRKLSTSLACTPFSRTIVSC